MDRTNRRMTIGILLAVASGLIGWDIYTAVDPTPGDTISEVLLGGALSHPIIPFLFGVVMGHLFWPQNANKS